MSPSWYLACLYLGLYGLVHGISSRGCLYLQDPSMRGWPLRGLELQDHRRAHGPGLKSLRRAAPGLSGAIRSGIRGSLKEQKMQQIRTKGSKKKKKREEEEEEEEEETLIHETWCSARTQPKRRAARPTLNYHEECFCAKWCQLNQAEASFHAMSTKFWIKALQVGV